MINNKKNSGQTGVLSFYDYLSQEISDIFA